MRKHLNIKIFGRVQGIGFRYSARRLALKLSLTGFVRNEPDGSVYLEVEGEEELLEKFLAWCRRGPLFAKVSKTEVQEGEFKNFTDFSILYFNK